MNGRAAAIVLFALATTACARPPAASGPSASAAATPAPQAVGAAPVREIAFAPQLELSGTVVAARQAIVGATAAGRVTAMFVRTGDTVSAGQPIARIDDAGYRASYAQARGSAGSADAGVAQAQAQAAAARARLGLAQTTAQRMAVLYGEGAIARQQYDEAAADLAAARAALAQSDAGVRAAAEGRLAARAAVAAAAVPLNDVVVRAPFAGIVLSRAVDPGAVVGIGSPVATVEDDAALELDVSLPETSAATVSPGMPVAVRIDALDGRTVPGTVRALIPASNAALRALLVKIELAPARGLYAGMFGRVRFAGPSHRAPAVPERALVTRAGQDGVFAIVDGRATFVPVQTGATEGEWVEVRDLPADVRRVAVAGVERLTDGTPVAAAP